jgi:outer membrane receptor protein involved in Fe transport
MVFDFGVRYDLWFPGKYAEDALANDSISPLTEAIAKEFENETIEIFGRRARSIISPRFGVSNLLTRNLSLFGSYSRFARKPPPQYLYAKLYTPSQSAYQLFGNPALDFEKVTNIEVGMKYLPNPNTAIGISGYLKNIQDYIAATVVSPDPRFPEETYFLYFNLDYATSQGVEIEYIQEYSDVVKLSANCAFSKAKGERALPADILRGLTARSEGEIYNEVMFDWDKPWQFVLKMDINAPRDRDIEFVGIPLPRDWNLGVKFWGQAGKRYTPYRETVDEFGFRVYEATGEINSEIGPWWNGLDFSFQKMFRLGEYNLSVYFEGFNILDHKNVTLINPMTGDVYKEGDTIPRGGNLFELPAPTYELPLWSNPTRYLSPRQLRLGVGVSF